MDHPRHLIASNRRSTEEPSLLMLNDDCLRHIFEHLDLFNFANLAKTSVRLQNVADTAHVKNFTEIEVRTTGCEISRSMGEFVDILSVIGRHLLSITMRSGDDLLLETIRRKCNNLKRLELIGFNGEPQLQDFRNLEKVKFENQVNFCINQLRRFFASNPGIVSVSYDLRYDEEIVSNFVESLQLLPKLKSLTLDIELSKNILQHVLHLDCLTRLSIRPENNDVLMELAKKLNLIELCLYVDSNDNTLDIIKSFENLEALCILGCDPYVLRRANVFSSKLKRITFYNIKMNCSTFLSVVEQLKFLEEFEILGLYDISEVEDEWNSKNSSEICVVLSQMVDELMLQLNDRILKISYRCPCCDQQLYLHNSEHLKIMNRLSRDYNCRKTATFWIAPSDESHSSSTHNSTINDSNNET